MAAASASRNADTAPGKAVSQTTRALLTLRDLVLEGHLKQGERVSELQLVELLGVSRTPVRAALLRLEEEGLLEALPSGGYAVRAFSEREVFEAVEIRGTLEGLAGRLAAERGVSAGDLDALRLCLDALDETVSGPELTEPGLARYIELNAEFHRLLVRAAGSQTLAREVERASALPFASPSALLQVQASAAEAHHRLTIAQDQHRGVVNAIERREGARAEALMREHARLTHRNLERAFANQRILALMPGAKLIRPRPVD